MNLRYVRTLIFTYRATNNRAYLVQARNLIEKMIKENRYDK